MELGASSETTSRSATQEFHISWNPRIHYRVYKSPPLVAILHQNYPVHTTESPFFDVHFNIIQPKALKFAASHGTQMFVTVSTTATSNIS
jgi:hypothetical protein